jgi:hypothetical protein
MGAATKKPAAKTKVKRTGIKARVTKRTLKKGSKPMTKEWTFLNELVDRDVFPGRITSLVLWGPPSTGKSSWAPYRFGRDNSEICPINEQSDQFSLLGSLLPAVVDGKPTIKWADGPAARAMRHGKILVLDEIDQASPELRPLLHALTECDPTQIRVMCADGTYLTPTKGFGVVATSNFSPDKLPESLQTRFLAVHIKHPAPGLLEHMGADMAEFFKARFARLESPKYVSPPTNTRNGFKIIRMREGGFDKEVAVRAALGDVDKGTVDAMLLVVK